MVEVTAPKGDNVLAEFTVVGKKFTLVATGHALDMLRKRKLNPWYVTSACLALGAEKLDRYNNSGKDIMIVDKAKNTTCIVTVENGIIVLITVLDKGAKSDPYVKADAIDRTVVEKFGSIA